MLIEVLREFIPLEDGRPYTPRPYTRRVWAYKDGCITVTRGPVPQNYVLGLFRAKIDHVEVTLDELDRVLTELHLTRKQIEEAIR